MKNRITHQQVARFLKVLLIIWAAVVIGFFIYALVGCEKNEPGIVPGCIQCDVVTTYYYPGQNPDHYHISASQYFCNDSTTVWDADVLNEENTWKRYRFNSPTDSVLEAEQTMFCHQFHAVCPE